MRCPKCGKDLEIRSDKSRHRFWACPGYPKCKYTASLKRAKTLPKVQFDRTQDFDIGKFTTLKTKQELDFYDKQLTHPHFFLEEVLNLTLEPFHKEWLHMAQKSRNTCIMAHRGSGKTEIMIVGYMLFKLYEAILDMYYNTWYHDRKWFEGAIISKSLPQSTGVLRRLKYRMFDSELLKRLMPEGRDGKISGSEIILKGRHRVVCRPYGDTVRGIHVNVACIDEAGTFEEKRTFTDAIVPIVQRYEGKLVSIGTPSSQVDLLYDMFKNKKFASKKYPAYKDSKKHIPLYGTSFSKKRLIEIEETIGTLAFSREYMVEPLSDQDRIFPFSLIQQGFIRAGKWIRERRSTDFQYYMGCDFAMSASAKADYSVFMVIEKDLNGKCRICEIKRNKGESFEVQMNKIRDMYNRFQPTNIMIDMRHIGHTFLSKLREEGLRVEEFKTTNKTKEELIMHLRNQFEKVNVLIPHHQSILPYGINPLIQELLEYAAHLTPQKKITYKGVGAHDDCIISLALAIYAATRFITVNLGIKRTSHARR